MRAKILIVEDDRSLAETLARAITLRGFAGSWRTSAEDALDLLAEESFAIVVTDMHMGGMDGLAFCEQVGARHPDVPVVMITAFGTAEFGDSAARVGAWDFIHKPFEVEVLVLVLERALAHRALREEVNVLRATSLGAAAPTEMTR